MGGVILAFVIEIIEFYGCASLRQSATKISAAQHTTNHTQQKKIPKTTAMGTQFVRNRKKNISGDQQGPMLAFRYHDVEYFFLDFSICSCESYVVVLLLF